LPLGAAGEGANILAKIFTKVTYRNKLLLFRLPTYFDVSYFFYYRAPFVPPQKKLGAHFVASDPGTENPSYATVQRCTADFAPAPFLRYSEELADFTYRTRVPGANARYDHWNFIKRLVRENYSVRSRNDRGVGCLKIVLKIFISPE